MSANSKIALAVAGGYMLGRTKKLRLAMTLAGMLAGKRMATNRQLLTQGAKLVENNPQLKQLQGQLTGRLVDVAREAALVAAASRVESFTRSLQPKDSDEDGQDAAPDDEDPSAEDETDTEAEDQDAPASEEKPQSRRSTSARTAPRATAKKAAAKKSTAKGSTAKKSTARKSTARKSTAKKSTAKKSTASSGR
ncbi:hypothetical protein [Pimelobacter simplex]|uniref:hypothetical protein n=1 Tax=Nocardioides simplex TaxID=2045 RepID=UPI0019327A04|nr:hypothetical protein [Pimelobacter simplex]